MARKIAIGDIHGCNKTFQSLLFDKLQISQDDEIYLLGDYIDRGPDSKGVINTILTLRNQGFQVYTLRGNHEQMMMDSVNDIKSYFQWVFNGGEFTMESFGVKRYQDMPNIYKDFFNSTKIVIQAERYILVHAGLNFKNEDIFEDQDFILWGRGFKPHQPKLGNKLLLHGHTPKPLEYILNQKGNIYNLDGGCVFLNKRKGLGSLVALILDDMEFVYLKCIDS